MMNIAIDVLLMVIIALVALLISFIIYLTAERKWQVLEQKRTENYVKEKQDKWFRYLIGGETFTNDLIPAKKCEFIGLEQIFLTYVNNLYQADIQEKIKQFSNKYLGKHYQRQLRSRRWSERMNALYRINDFQMDSLLDSCERLEKRKLTNDEYFLLLRIYAVFAERIFISKLLRLSVTFSEYEFKKLFSQIGSHSQQIVKDDFNQLPLVAQYTFIEILGIKREIESLPFLERQLKNQNDEIRIRSLKAIYEIGIISNLEIYTPFVTSTIWEERLMSAKLLGNLPLEETLPFLKKLIEDNNWWVRLQAAKTIKKDRFGNKVLEKISHSTSDHYAIEMANDVLRQGS